MSRLRTATCGALLFGFAVTLFGSACVPVAAEPVGAPPSTPAYAPPPAAYGAAPATDSEGVEDDVAYDESVPVDDIETYPSIVFDGAPVYYVGGTWYRHDRRGWGVYRREPQGLAQQRARHERDPQWVRAAQRPASPAPRPAAPEPQPAAENRPHESPRQGVTEWQSAPPRPQPHSPSAGPGQTVSDGHPAVPAPRPEGRTNAQPVPPPRAAGAKPSRSTPSHAPAQGSEHR